MQYLFFDEHKKRAIEKKLFTVGMGGSFDITFPADKSQLAFTIYKSAQCAEIVPGDLRVKLNGKTIHKKTQISSCDRIEFAERVGVFLSSTSDELFSPSRAQPTGDTMREIFSRLQTQGDFQGALEDLLSSIVVRSGADVGCLAAEYLDQSDWTIFATNEGSDLSFDSFRDRKTVLSNTILKETLKSRKPVYIESIIGHPWANEVSVVEAKIFSAACLPLMVADRIFGAVFLYTRAPGRIIQKESLDDLAILASQAALVLISRAEVEKTKLEIDNLRHGKDTQHKITYGANSPMLEVLNRVTKIAQSNITVLLRGETGTGKELVAREIHDRSGREKFVAINCAAIPETLLESTLFGYEKGAFTGAEKSRMGKVEEANGGTLFLDEIGDLPSEVQAKLLRVLQEKRVEPLGARQSVEVDFRLISATHQNLETMIQDKKFRADLFYRLNGATVSIPPLRERSMDIECLVDYFLSSEDCTKPLSEAALRNLKEYSWPGNVRELQQTIARAVLLSDGNQILPQDIELQELPIFNTLSSIDSSMSLMGLRDAQDKFTRRFVKKALLKSQNNRQAAAKKLGVSERTLYRILSDSSDMLS